MVNNSSLATITIKTITFILSIFCSISIFSQNIKKTIALDDPQDIIINKVEGFYFTPNGEYYFYKDNDGFRYFITKNDTIKLRQSVSIAGIYGKHGEITTVYSTPDSFYYKNTKALKLYNHGYGKVIKHITDFTNNNVALTTEKNDSIYYFLNDHFLIATHKDSCQDFPSIEKWCSFSENGNALYNYRKGGMGYIVLNTSVLDSSKKRFIQLEVNNRGDYFYGIGKNGIPNTKFDYMFFPVYNGHRFDSVRTIWNSFIRENGGFYCTGGNPDYILINGDCFNNTKAKNIILIDSVKFFFLEQFSNGVNKKIKYTTSSQSGELPYSENYRVEMNNTGEFSIIYSDGSKHKILINGKEREETVVGMPMSIDAKGNCFSFQQKGKKTTIYKNGNIILKTNDKIKVFDKIQFFESYLADYSLKNKPQAGHSFDYFETKDNGYIIWNGEISEPLKKMSWKRSGSEYPVSGQILAGGITEYGFYIIQHFDKKKSILILNNKTIELDEAVESIVDKSIYFTSDKLIFYAICKNKVKRFEVTF